MTTLEYNKIFYPAYSKAYCFVRNLNHALQKSDDNARMQLRCIGWDDETMLFLLDALQMMHDAAKTSYSWSRREWWVNADKGLET